jgi:hypothetical protein
MYYYELHEGDDDLFHDILLARDEEIDPEEFFELVQTARRRVQDTFEDDTLIEAVAAELEREHGFIAITDDRLMAAVHVSTEEEENYLTELVEEEEEDDDAGGDSPDFRGILLDWEPKGPPD